VSLIFISLKVSKTLAKHVRTQLRSELARKTGLAGSKTDLAGFSGKNGLPGFRTSLASFCGSRVENLLNIIINSFGLHETDHMCFLISSMRGMQWCNPFFNLRKLKNPAWLVPANSAALDG
jgi:hypothetical protein